MAAPAFGTVGTVASGIGTSVACGAPASVSAGDMLVAIVGTNAATTITGLPTGWAHAPNSPLTIPVGGTNNKVTLNVMWKRATGTDAYTFTQSASDFHEGAAMRFTSVVASGNPWDGSSSNTATDNTQGTVSPAVAFTTTGADEMFVAAWSNWAGGTWTDPSGFTLAFGTSSAKIVMADYKVQTVAGSSGSISATCASTAERASWLGALIGTTGGASTINGTATVAGVGAVSAAVVQAAVVKPAGAGATSANVTLAAVVSPAGLGSAGASVVQRSSVAPTGTGVVAANVTQRSGVSVAGAGSMSTLVTQGVRATAAGAGSVTANAAGTVAAPANLVAAGAVTAASTQVLRAAAGAVGGGILAAAGTVITPGDRYVIRPDTGPVARPATGTAFRPNAGTTTRPDAGLVIRPDTGIVSRP